MSDNSSNDDKEVRLAEITHRSFENNEKYKFFRTACICGTILAGMLIVAFTVIDLAKPDWIAALEVFAGLLAPGGLFGVFLGRKTVSDRKDRKRILELETEVERLRSATNENKPLIAKTTETAEIQAETKVILPSSNPPIDTLDNSSP